MPAREPQTGVGRALSDAEVATYRRDGWVHLPGFVAREDVGALLALAQARMGVDGRGNVPSSMPQGFFNPEFGAGLGDPVLRPVIDRAAANAQTTNAFRAGLSAPNVGCKAPAVLPRVLERPRIRA